MSKQILVSVFDKKASSFGPPQAFDHVTQALRVMVQAARTKPDSQLVQFCADYDLYDVGMFDQLNGVVTPTIPPGFVESMINLVSEAKPKGQGNG